MKHALGLGLLVLAACSVDAAPIEGELSANQEIMTALPNGVDRPFDPKAAAAARMQYYGGAVIPNAKVYVVWWGDGSNLLADLKKPVGGIADFYAGVLNSNYMDSLAEYNTTIPAQVGSHRGQPGTNQRIGRGNYAGTIAMTAIPSTTNLTDELIQSTIESNIDSGALPTPDENTLFAIYFPRSVRITIEGMRSCISFGAYHFATPKTQHHAAYAVMPDCGYSFSGVTNVSSHELAEAVSDVDPTPGSNPDYPQAWNSSDGSEISDICVNTSGNLATPKGTFNVTGNWDELSRGCKVTHPLAAQDFSVAYVGETVGLIGGASATLTFKTATAVGAAQPLNVSVKAPTGVNATISSPTASVGDTLTVTISATPGVAVRDGQVVVTAVAPNGVVHTAAALVQVQ